VIIERMVEKAEPAIISTEAGMQIESNNEHLK
jgi:hypothetical protein